jgi:uncharacterized protein YhaN
VSVRLQRLDLIRYGHFTDSSFELPAGKSDFHIVFGPNESGKSTALAAIEDLLFGIPVHSPYNFLHDYTSMRLGAVLENGSASLEVLRRKGNKDTLLRPDGSPVSGGEGVLRPYLAGADRSFFVRMFSLDPARLQTGGQEILQARDDAGQMLFSAGAGIAGLRERLGELAAEADELWSERRARHRKFYIADDKLKEAQKKLREQTFTASKWRELKQAYEEAEEVYAKVDKKIKETSAERNRLGRIRRVFRDVHRKHELDGQLAELGDVIALPEDAAKLAAEAERKDTVAATRIATLQEQLKRAGESLKGLTFDETLFQRAEDVRQLHERRIEIRREKADLPRREAELDAAEEELRANASELGWTVTDSAALIERIPPRTKAHLVRSLLNQRGELEADVTSHARLLQESQATRNDVENRLDETGKPADVSRLAIVIKSLREQGDLTGRLRTAQNALEDAKGRIERRLEALKPGVSDEKALTNIAVPARAQIQECREREQDWKRRLREAQQNASSAQQELDGAVAAFERTVRDEHVVTAEVLKDARSRRDALWTLVKLRHVRGEPIPEHHGSGFEEELDDLAGAFEPAMAKADDLADQRFDHAEAAGRIAEIKRKIGEQRTLLEQMQENESKLVEEGKQLKAEWTSMWTAAPFDPLAAEDMLDWLDARKDVLEAIEERQDAESALEAARNEDREAREQVLSELAALGLDVAALDNDSLNFIIERAAEEQSLRESEAEKKAWLKEEVDNAAKDVTRRERDLQQAKEALDKWQKKWTAALGGLGLAEDTAPEAVGTQVDIIDQMRETAGCIRSLRHDRIEKINRDVADFEQVVGKLVEELAEDLSGQPAEDTVLELERRLADAERSQALREKKIEEVEGLKIQITGLEDERRESTASVSHLKKLAAVETNEALKEAIERSDQRRSLEDEQQQIIDKLQHDGDGKSLEELEEECEGAVIDKVAAREASIQTELEDLRKQQTNAAEERSRAREAFHAVGGDDAAARASATKQEAVAEMREAAERYVRVKTSAILLQWAIDRYRREKQAPLLKRAGELFKIMTGSSFCSLQVAFDDQDKAHLTGLRPDGGIVPVSGMSTGTADQLYLALRVASIEDYLERADALPFVADDLFINFDDERAAAGLRLLKEMSQKTQVLFFTHHQHLVDIARKTLGASVSLVTLTDQEVAAA